MDICDLPLIVHAGKKTVSIEAAKTATFIAKMDPKAGGFFSFKYL